VFVFPPDFLMWVISLLFGAFCVLIAYRITVKLGQTASQQLWQGGDAKEPTQGGDDKQAAKDDGGGNGIEIHIGEWLQIATKSPAVAFFILGVCSGLALPAFYSWLYSPQGAKGAQIITARGQFNPDIANVCFQTDQVVSDSAGYSLKIPRQVRSITYIIQAPGMSGANLLIEQDGSGADYSIDEGPLKPVAVDHGGNLAIGDPIPLINNTQAAALKSVTALGQQTVSNISNVLTGKR
jgi:hypothetical protein